VIVDAHTHLTAKTIGTEVKRPAKVPFPSYAYSVREEVNTIANLEYMDRVGIDRAIILPLPIPPAMNVPSIFTTEMALEAAAIHPDRFIPFGTFDPRLPGISYKDEIQRLVDAGCRGFGEWKPNPPEDSLRVDDLRAKEIYALCGEAGLPVLLHLDSRINRDIDGFEQVVAEFEDTVFIAHGPAWWAHMAEEVPPGVSYPTGPVERPGKVARMLEQYPNLYADTSAGSGLRALTRDPRYTQGFVSRLWHKLLFGTDFPCRNGQTGMLFGLDQSHLNLIRGFDLPAAQKDAILGGTLLKLVRGGDNAL